MCVYLVDVFFFKQKTAYEMRISDWSSDVCSSDLPEVKKWLYQAVLPVVQVMPFTAEAALILAKMHALPQIRQQMQPGRSSKKVLPGADVMIAAVAISLNAVVVTHNVVDYLSVHEQFT